MQLTMSRLQESKENCFVFPDLLNSEGRMSVGEALVDVLKDAAHEDRLTQGFFECGKLLQSNPSNVMLCVLAEGSEVSRDVAFNIHTTLLEAFCLENDIWVIKVDSIRKLCKLLMIGERGNGEAVTTVKDSPCMIIEFPINDAISLAEEDLISFCRLTADISPQPIIELPS